jgi:hypothetical protein
VLGCVVFFPPAAIGIPALPIGGLLASKEHTLFKTFFFVLSRDVFSLDQQRAAVKVNERAEEQTLVDEPLDSEIVEIGTHWRARRRRARTSTAAPARTRTSHPGIPDRPGPYPGALGAVLGQF